MIRHLHVRHLALIDELSVDFDRGLSALTGETGAGKTMVLEALGLLAGLRASPSLVRSGEDRATVDAVIEIAREGRLAARLKEMGLEPEAEGEIILRREVLASGRSRASINGRLVPIGQLAEIASHVLEISSQHEQQRLVQGAVQRDFFDEFAGLLPRRGKVKEAYERLAEAEKELERLRTDDRDREQRRDFLRFQVDELEELGLRDGELDELEGECRRLEHMEELREQGGVAVAALADHPEGEACGLDLMGRTLAAVEDMAGRDPALGPLAERLVDLYDQLSDAGFELSRYVEMLEAEPDRLNELNRRIDAIGKALRKHGPTEADALGRLEEMKRELEGLENWDACLEEAEKKVEKARERLLAAARDLSAAREKAGPKFLRPLKALLKDFSMPKVRLDLAREPVSSGLAVDEKGTLCGPAGLENVELLFTANEGEALRPLSRVASGGELSRIMLALRTLSAEWQAAPVMIFDEVDAGISGTAARRVAERLAALGERFQILCVTHNPSVASAARHHFLVEKREKNGRTYSTLSLAEGIRRQGELARLLDGGKRSDRSMALAAELLETA